MRHFTDHAAERAHERYAVAATDEEWSRAALDIMDVVAGVGRAALLLARLPGGRERWAVRVGQEMMTVVYLPRAAIILTVLPGTRRAG